MAQASNAEPSPTTAAPRVISIDLDQRTVMTDDGKALRTDSSGECVHCGSFTLFKIWRWDVASHKGSFVFDCGCKYARMMERVGQ